MTTVTLATHCHSRDLPRLHAPGVLEELISCHGFPFNEILVIHQRCEGLQYSIPKDDYILVLDIPEIEYPHILNSFGIPHLDPVGIELTHGWDAPHYYEHHCVNHCREIIASRQYDYIVFTDADCRIVNQPDSWIAKGIEILEKYPEAFIVAPSDGGQEFNFVADGCRFTQTVSQQIFMGRTKQFKELDFTNLQWDGKFDAPYGPFQEFYMLFEGWMFRYMRANNLYRAVLPESYRYWHLEYH
jgi:hypothetical protein